MKWSEAIARIDWNDPKQVEGWIDTENLVAEMGFDYYVGNFYGEEVQNRMKKVWLHCWLCTDTIVGAAAYFLDGELIVVSYQSARKSHELFQYVSEEAYEKLKSFFRSLEDAGKDYFAIANLDTEIPK